MLFTIGWTIYVTIFLSLGKRNPKFLKYLKFMYYCPDCPDDELEIAEIIQKKSFISDYSGIEHITSKECKAIRCKKCKRVIENI